MRRRRRCGCASRRRSRCFFSTVELNRAPPTNTDPELLRALVIEQQRTITRLAETLAEMVARLPEATAERAPEVITRRSPSGDHAPVTKPMPTPTDQRQQAQKRPASALSAAWRAVWRRIGESATG